MSKYDRVKGLLDVVALDQGHFDFSSSSHCMIAIGIDSGYINEGDTFSEPKWMVRVANDLNLTEKQITEVYCGHIELRHQHVNEGDQASIVAFYDLMRDKAFCINYVRSIIETWEAVDRAATRDCEAIRSFIETYESCNA